jgi:hypothetical protein
MNTVITILVLGLVMAISLYIEKSRKWLKSILWTPLPLRWKRRINKFRRGIWDDEVAQKKSQQKAKGKITEVPIFKADGKTPVMDVIKKGRKHGFWKRVGMFFLALIVVAVFQWMLVKFADSLIFRITLSSFISWLALASIKKYRWKISLTICLTGLLAILSIIYLPAFKETFASAVNWLVWTALIFFIVEELFNKNWYPKSVGFGGLGIVVVIFIVAAFNLIRSHEFYTTEGSRANINVIEKQQEIVALETLKSRASKPKTVVGFYKPISSSLSGLPSGTSQVAINWSQLVTKNNLPTEYGRVEAVMSKLLFIVYFSMAYAVFMLVAIPEMIGDTVRSYKSKRSQSKGKEGGGVKEGLTATSYVILELFGRIVDDVIKGRIAGKATSKPARKK